MKRTPYWTNKGKAIHLSGGDQIQIMVKEWHGSWKKYLRWSEKLVDVHGQSKHDQALRIRDFERKNHIRFRYENKDDGVYWTPVRRKK